MRLISLLLLGGAMCTSASAQDILTCETGPVIIVDGERTCQETDSLSTLIRDFEATELAGDIFRRGEEGDTAALRSLPDVSPEALTEGQNINRRFLARHAVLGASLQDASDQDRMNYELLGFVLMQRQRMAPFGAERIPFTNDSGFFNTLSYISRQTKFETASDYESYAARLTRVPAWFGQHKANMRRGMEDGFTASAGILPDIIESIDALATGPVESHPLFLPFTRIPDTISEPERIRLAALGRAAMSSAVKPAYANLREFMEDEYMPAARQTDGLGRSETERDYYRALTRYFTTLDLTPDEVHALGQSEVRRIRSQMDAVIAETDFSGSFAEFLVFLRTDPQFYAKTEDELLMRASYLAKKIDGKMPEWFATLPRLSYGVIPVPAEIAKGYTTGRYFGGNPETGRAGNFVVNTYDLPQRPLYNLPALAAHEGVPGHHHQIALSQELKDLPKFRQSLYPNAFGEGWGLYSEKLAGEMGIYETPYERFGQLTYEMWRACRLVVDTGLHWLGWDREQAESCFRENSALSELNIKNEVSRYISWPGQALAYKVGELKILELREKTQKALGDDFDIRRFHDAVLTNGGIPLDMLEEQIERFIATERIRLATQRSQTATP